MSEGVEKACYFCGESCVGQPRGKDPRGRYYHRACLEDAKAQSRSEAHHPDPLEDDSFTDEPLLEAGAPPVIAALPVMSGQTCPECNAALAVGAVLCTSCGLDLRTGGHAYVPGKAPKSRGDGGQAVWPLVIGPISILLGLGGIGVAVLGATGSSLSGNSAGLVGPIVNGLLALGLLLGGAQMTLRNQGCMRTLRIWAIAKFSLTVLCTGAAVGLLAMAGGMSERISEEAGFGIDVGTLIVIALAAAALSLIWPTFILIWLGRDAVKKEIGGW